MKIRAIALALLLPACASQQPAPVATAMDQTPSLAAAEAAFAAQSVRSDMRSAFLGALAADGMLVRTGWVVGIDWFRDRPAPPIVLDWRPQYVEVAASGELGLSTGPWKITNRSKPGTPPAYGQFVSVWRRDGSGPWKVAADLGTAHPADSLWKAPLETRQLRAPLAVATEGVAQAEARFAADTRARGTRAAYGMHGADNLRFYRSGHEPHATRTAALASTAMADERLAWTVDRTETARSGDFGYALGAYSAAGSPGTALGWYLRAWRRESAGWRIVMDVTVPAPPKP